MHVSVKDTYTCFTPLDISSDSQLYRCVCLTLIYVSIDNAGLITSRTTPSHHRVDSNGKLSSAPELPSNRHLDILTFCQPQVSAQSATRRDQNACEHFQHSRATSSKCLTRTKSRVKNASIRVCDRGWKQRHCCCQALLHKYSSEPPYLTAYVSCDVSSRGFFLIWRARLRNMQDCMAQIT